MPTYEIPSRVVVALGGNVLDENPAADTTRVDHVAEALLGLIAQGSEVIITHGNGHQISMVESVFDAAEDAIGTPQMDLPECGAMTQGIIGYHLQQAIGRQLHRGYKRMNVATVITQIEVEADDPAFAAPVKPIGPSFTEEKAREIAAKEPDLTYAEDPGRGWRRMVASPEPKKIVEAESILNLLDNDFIVIACGGGGVPVVRDYADKGCYKGVPAVIEKDAAAELLAEDCDAEELILLTAVDGVYTGFGTDGAQLLAELSADEADELAAAGEFGARSMGVKVAAAVKFVRSRPGRTAVIGSLEQAAQVMHGDAGTRIYAE